MTETEPAALQIHGVEIVDTFAEALPNQSGATANHCRQLALGQHGCDRSVRQRD